MNAAAAAPQAPPSCGSPAGAPSTFAGDLSDREGGLAAAASVAPGESGEAPEGRLLPPHRGPLAAPSPPPPPPAGRRRSLSVATGQPALETVVVKAKRAASSLWMLLHAQNCAMAGKCPHSGCHEAKMMHLHLKMCPAAAGGGSEGGRPCPAHYHGCDQARKLLAHHRRCKGLRSRNAPSSYCLVCSFVARQARTVLERGSGRSPGASAAGASGGPALGPMPGLRKHPPPSSSRLQQHQHHPHQATVSFVVDASAARCIEASSTPSPPSPSLGTAKAEESARARANGILKKAHAAPAPAPPFPHLKPLSNSRARDGSREEESGDESKDGDVEMLTTADPPAPPAAVVLTEPDVASLLCSLAGTDASSMQHRSDPSSPPRRDRAVSSADGIFGCPDPAPPGGAGGAPAGRRRSVSLGGEPRSRRHRRWDGAEETIYEDGSSQASRESMEPL